MRYVIYLRVSTDQQADHGFGLEVQEEACRRWLREGRHRLVEVCTDAAKLGSLDAADRPGLARALTLVGADRADGILVHRLDRLARDLVLQEQLLLELHRRGKELHSCSPTEDANLEHAPEDPTRALVRRILASIAQYEREVIRLRLKAGKARKQLTGGYAGGAPPYGYAAIRGELAPLPDEQKALKLMRRLRREGASYRAIAAELHRRDIPSRSPSGIWRPGVIHTILSRAEMRQQARANALPSPDIVEVSA